MRAPRVSVVMPVYNSRPAFFHKTFPALLGQSYGDFELILSDNGSSAEARALYEEAAKLDPRVRLLTHAHNYGAALNFNYAFAQARGEYFMWSADDDLRATDYLLRTVERLDASPRAVSAGTQVVLVDSDGRRHARVDFDPCFALPRPSQRVPVRGSTIGPAYYMDIYALHRRSALARTTLNQPMHGSDVMLVRELLLQGPIERVDEELFFYRQPTSYTMESLAVAMLGHQARTPVFRYPAQYLALQLLVSVATNDVPIDEGERRACLLALAASLARHGWFTRERHLDLRARASQAWRSRDYPRAALALAEALAVAPSWALSPDIWRRVARRFKKE